MSCPHTRRRWLAWCLTGLIPSQPPSINTQGGLNLSIFLRSHLKMWKARPAAKNANRRTMANRYLPGRQEAVGLKRSTRWASATQIRLQASRSAGTMRP